MSHQLAISPATNMDTPILLEMIQELAAFEGLSRELEVTAESLGDALFGAKPVAGALLARVGSAAAGYAVYFRTFSTFVGRPGIFVDDLFVRPAFRQRGIGHALLRQVARICENSGGGRLEWIALRWNTDALRFYKRIGAAVMDEWALLRISRAKLRLLTADSAKARHD